MAVSWSILSKTRVKARCFASSEFSVGEVDIPFDLRADFIPDIANEISKSRADKFKSVIIDDNDFYNKTSFQSDAMRRVQEQAFLAADHSFPVLINGELGTEKQLLQTNS